jgi:hypothetical protein
MHHKLYIRLVQYIHGCTENRVTCTVHRLVYVPPARHHVTGCLLPAANESTTCSSTGGKQQQQPARGRAGAVYTALSLTFSVASVQCAETWFLTHVGLETFGRILIFIICIALVLYNQKDTIFVDLTINVSPIYFSGTSSNVLSFYVLQPAFFCVFLPLKNIGERGLQCIEIISVSNRVITMLELPSPRDESSHGKSRQNVWRDGTHFRLLCLNVLAISWIYHYNTSCIYQYSSDCLFMCQYMNRYMYMLRVPTLPFKHITMKLNFFASYLYVSSCLSRPYILLKNSSVYVYLYIFSICNSSRSSAVNVNSLNLSSFKEGGCKTMEKLVAFMRQKSDIIILSDCRLKGGVEKIRKILRVGRGVQYNFFANSSRSERGVCFSVNRARDIEILQEERDLRDENFYLLRCLVEGKALLIGGVYGPNINDAAFFNNLRTRVESYGIPFILES